MFYLRLGALVGLATALLAQTASAENVLELNRSFIEQYKNKLTISGAYFVDAAHKKPNPAKSDGDLHAAGRSAAIGLPACSNRRATSNASRPPMLWPKKAIFSCGSSGGLIIWQTLSARSPMVVNDPRS